MRLAMSGVPVHRMSSGEFGECEMISDVKLNCHPREAVSKKQSGAGRCGDGSGRERE